MLLTVTIKLTSPFLGSAKLNEDGIRNIIKTNKNQPTIFIKRFCNLCKKYALDLGIINYNYNSINLPNYVKTEAVEKIYERSYKTKEGTFKREKFMSYPVGSIITMDCYIDDTKIDVDKAVKILELIGKYDGISQFGINANFGRYEIVLCSQQKYE